MRRTIINAESQGLNIYASPLLESLLSCMEDARPDCAFQSLGADLLPYKTAS